MKSRRMIWVLVGVVVLAAAGAAAVLLDPAARVRGWAAGEPFYQDRAAAAWDRDLRQQDEVARVKARDELANGKGDAVPVCEWLLGHAADSQVRWRAAEALKAMKKDAAPAAPALLAALDDPDPLVRAVAGEAVEELAPNLPAGSLATLVKAFPNVGAIRAVAKYRRDGADAVPQLIALLRHENAKVRENAARTLGWIGEPAAASVPDLTDVMGKDPEALVREHCAESLGQIGPASVPAIPALVKALKDPNVKVRRDAVRSLGQLGPAAKAALPEVKALANDEAEIIKKAVADAVAKIDPPAKK